MSYYATARRGKRTAYLAGPYRTHGAALRALIPAKREACRIEPDLHFDASFGTARVKHPHARRRIGTGKLNHIIDAPKDYLP